MRCEQCERYNTLPEDQKASEAQKQSDHEENKKIARALMKSAKEEASSPNEDVRTINFDMEKVLTTPRAEIGPLYYCSKLCVWNFTIYELASHKGLCHVWNETIGCRGSNEIASFLWKYFKEESKKGVRLFLLFSDNCGGQNRNKMVFSMFIKAAAEFKIKIVHRY